ncbi:TonB C-terminal domain-containing protein [Desulfuromonas acetexigens]|uniref:TonB C-terminal domain-containing protein n=1 Tax=Trichloromonas acetexigens TaxID=38815 RepID=A0A550JBK3_9BACT|nr:TonB C-terminal domain-containing protein [Desulfuromonas acetexigens]
MQKKQEYAGAQAAIEALAAKTAKASAGNVPVGMPDGKGSEEGVLDEAWLKEFLTRAWGLSPYQVTRTDLEAKVQLTFDSQGKLSNYKFLDKSTDSRFDDSVVKAILKLKENPMPTLAGTRKEVVFNLKELQRQ